MSRERKRREEALPPGYSFRQRDIQSYKKKVRREDQAHFMEAVHKYGFQNDWDVIGPDGDIVLRVAGSERARAIEVLKLQIKGRSP